MTGLSAAQLLSGAAPPVHRGALVPSADVMAAEVGAAGWTVRRLPEAGVRDGVAFLAACGRALDFPHWYGQNWDALGDCLVDLSWLPGPGTALLWTDSAALAEADPAAWRTALDVFASSAITRAGLGRAPLHLLVPP
ncbi:barstar family protein [Luedemannella helvata]|uniref:Barstar family protein n=1 Tax=Luedemannella helvata TaxID=349315 RepID=A0ABP4W356_9ACTN